MKRPFEVGDRVRVYGNPPAVADEESIAEGTVEEVTREDRNISVRYDRSGKLWHVYPQQCRRLKPKSKAKKEARRVWLQSDSFAAMKRGLMVVAWDHKPELPKEIEFRECLPGEVVVTRETLAKAYRDAWSQIPLDEDTSNETMISLIAKSLGLEVCQ